MKKIQYNQPVPISFTFAERDLIFKETFAGGEIMQKLKIAINEGNKIKVQYTLDDLEELIGYIAAAANHSEKKSLQNKLDKLIEKLQKRLDSYEEAGPEA
jgi:hypothetical protein